jgi:hypothetical protein
MTRYMSKANFIDFLDDMLGWTAMKRYHSFHDFLLTARRNNSKKLGGVGNGSSEGTCRFCSWCLKPACQVL